MQINNRPDLGKYLQLGKAKPTEWWGKCWEAHVDMVIEFCLNENLPENFGSCLRVIFEETKLEEVELFLVHALIIAQGGEDAGQEIAHCWVEAGDYFVYDRTTDTAYNKKVFYETTKASENKLVRYTWENAVDWIKKSRHSGPWEPTDNLFESKHFKDDIERVQIGQQAIENNRRQIH